MAYTIGMCKICAWNYNFVEQFGILIDLIAYAEYI